MLGINFVRWCVRQLEDWKGWVAIGVLALVLDVVVEIIFDILTFFNS